MIQVGRDGASPVSFFERLYTQPTTLSLPQLPGYSRTKLSLPPASAVGWECWRAGSRCGRLPESSCKPLRTSHRCRRGGNRWARRSVSQPRPATCGRTNNAISLRFSTCFSLGFTPLPVPRRNRGPSLQMTRSAVQRLKPAAFWSGAKADHTAFPVL